MVTKPPISTELLARIMADAEARAPEEACGLLLGGQGRIVRVVPARNVAAEPRRHFEIDPATLFAALRAERAGGPALAGYYHSHPSGDARPSATDAAMAAPDGRLWLIVARAAWSLWRAVDGGALGGRFDPVACQPCSPTPKTAITNE